MKKQLFNLLAFSFLVNGITSCESKETAPEIIPKKLIDIIEVSHIYDDGEETEKTIFHYDESDRLIKMIVKVVDSPTSSKQISQTEIAYSKDKIEVKYTETSPDGETNTSLYNHTLKNGIAVSGHGTNIYGDHSYTAEYDSNSSLINKSGYSLTWRDGNLADITNGKDIDSLTYSNNLNNTNLDLSPIITDLDAYGYEKILVLMRMMGNNSINTLSTSKNVSKTMDGESTSECRYVYKFNSQGYLESVKTHDLINGAEKINNFLLITYSNK